MEPEPVDDFAEAGMSPGPIAHEAFGPRGPAAMPLTRPAPTSAAATVDLENPAAGENSIDNNIRKALS